MEGVASHGRGPAKIIFLRVAPLNQALAEPDRMNLSHAAIEAHFNQSDYARQGLRFRIESGSFHKSAHMPPATKASGTLPYTRTERVTQYFLACDCQTVRAGLPGFHIHSLVVGSRFFGSIFRLLRWSRPRVPFGNAELDRRLDLLAAEGDRLTAEIPCLFAPDIHRALGHAVAGNFRGSIVYDSLRLRMTLDQLPETDNDLKTMAPALDMLLLLQRLLSQSHPDPVRAVARAWQTLKTRRAWEQVTWSSPEGGLPHPDYPQDVLGFINVLSSDFWADYDYTSKPVRDWLASPERLKKLSTEDLKAVFTHIVRSERFCDGAWQSTLKSGLMDELLATRTFQP